jgi:hypothetical protein
MRRLKHIKGCKCRIEKKPMVLERPKMKWEDDVKQDLNFLKIDAWRKKKKGWKELMKTDH